MVIYVCYTQLNKIRDEDWADFVVRVRVNGRFSYLKHLQFQVSNGNFELRVKSTIRTLSFFDQFWVSFIILIGSS